MSHDQRKPDALRPDRAASQMMAGRADQSERDHGRDDAIPRWNVGIAVVLAVLWATYLLLLDDQRGQQAAVDEVVAAGLLEAVEMLMVQTAAGDAAPPGPTATSGSSGDTATLVGPTWVAEDIRSRGVIDYLQSSITLTTGGQAYGFGGCNHFNGRYALGGAMLTLGPLAGTRKACPPAIMNHETRFHHALDETRRYRFENGSLFLLDAQGASIMRLWRRD
jgi:putative lipoprotein